MPNQLNYVDQIPTPYIAERPERLSHTDRSLTQVGTRQILFGTSDRDYVEIWVYDSNGSIVGHVNLAPTDPAVSLTTVADNTGAYEMLNIDMGQAVRLMTIETGRYGFVANFFKDEVGTETTDHLYISTISDDRTELRLYPKNITNQLLRDLYEWVVPSVPKLEAQGLIDQTFARSLDFTSADSLNPNKVLADLNLLLPGTEDRMIYSGASSTYSNMMYKLINQAGVRAIEKMAADVNNLNVQDADLEKYITQAVGEIIREFRDSGQVDPRFEVF